MPLFALEALRGLTGRLVTLTLLHSVWIGLLAASLAALALRRIPVGRRGVCHALLLAALAVAGFGPVVATSLQRWRVHARETFFVDVRTAEVRVVSDGPSANVGDAFLSPRPSAGHALIETPIRGNVNRGLARIQAWLDVIQPFVLAAWLMVVVPLGLIVGVGVCVSQRLRRESAAAPSSIQARSDRLARGLGLRWSPPVRIHSPQAEPCLCGLVRPAIILPRCWLDGAEDDRLEAILAHELAHARRLDLPVNLVQRVIEVALFFHPAVLCLSRSLRAQRERCADALAVGLTGNPLALAEALESVARQRRSRRCFATLGESLGGGGLSLLVRIQEILGMTPTRPPARFWPLAALPAALLVAVFSVSVTLAQDPPRVVAIDRPRAVLQPVREPEPGAGRNDLTQLLDHSRIGASGQNALFDFRTDATSYSNHQLSYEFRYIDVGNAGLWRERFGDRLRPIQMQGETNQSAWLLDPDQTLELLTLIQGDVWSYIVQAPKATTFEGAHLTIVSGQRLSYVADVQAVRRSGSIMFKPELGSLTVGSAIDVAGKFVPGGTNLTIGVRDKALVAFHTFQRTVDSRKGRIGATYQVPTTTERHGRSSCVIPENSSLMVSLGLEQRSGRLSRLVEAAVGLLEAVGVPALEARGETAERLVLITPRRIVLDETDGRVSWSLFDSLVPKWADGSVVSSPGR